MPTESPRPLRPFKHLVHNWTRGWQSDAERTGEITSVTPSRDITSSNNNYARLVACDSAAERIVAHFDLAPYFERVYGPDLDGNPSDKADLLATLVERESVEPATAVMIGDRKHDMHAARRNNLRGLGVLYGFGDAPELHAAGAEDVCDQVEDIPPAIVRMLGR